MRNEIVIVAMVGAVALAITVGNRLASETLAVLTGALCGVTASLPVSIAVLILANKNWGRDASRNGQAENLYNAPRVYAPQQPVVIVSPPQMQMPYYFPSPQTGATLDSRDFKIVGGEE